MKNLLSIQKSSFTLAILTLISFFILSTINSYSQTPADFTDTWKLDLSKSSTLPHLVSETLVITQKGNDITINRTLVTTDTKPIISTFIYSIGVVIDDIKSNTGITTISSSWSADKQTFSVLETFVSDRNGTKQESKRTTVYSMTDKGKTLNIISDDTLPIGSPTPESERHMKMIFTKS